jgi:hypothetical protein
MNPAMPRGRQIEYANAGRYVHSLLERARDYPIRQLSHRFLSLTGIDFDLRSSSPDYLGAAVRGLLPGASINGESRQLTLRVLDARSTGLPEPLGWSDKPFTAKGLSDAVAPYGLSAWFDYDWAAWQIFDPAAGDGLIMMQTADAHPPWELSAPFRCFIQWSAMASNRMLVHAASLGEDGRGVLIAGAGGAGKSTTTVCGLLEGLTSVGDDYVLVDAATSTPSAHAVFSTIKIDPAGLSRIGRLDIANGRRANWQHKYELHAHQIRPGCQVASLALQAIILPTVDPSAPAAIEPASESEALQALMPSTLTQLPVPREEGFRFLSRLVRLLPAFRLRIPASPREAVDLLRRQFDWRRPQ